MDGTESHATTFILSSEMDIPEYFFQGYCFDGADYVFGMEGADQYRDATNSRLRGGLDGCYVVVERVGGAVRIENDHAGYKIIYYYHDGDRWVVSNSYARILDYLRTLGVATIPNYVHLSAIGGRGSGNSQLFSFETPTRGIRVLPRACTLHVTGHKVSIEQWPERERLGYSEGLRKHLELWLQRVETLMIDPRTDFTTDVTGGVDSRTNFALVARAGERLGTQGTQPRLNCGWSSANTRDLVVAEELTAQFGLELNDDRRFPSYVLSAQESYNTFRDLNGGVYYPIYQPVEAPMPGKISIGGGGGEIHRRFYENHQKSRSIDRFLNSYASRLTHPWMSAEFVYAARQSLAEAFPGNPDPLRIHYREFRHRYHVGRSPRYGVSFTPLDSVSADIAQSQAGPERLDEGQFNYDIMASLKPELLDIPFDSDSKAPTESVRVRLSAVLTASEANPGTVWAPVAEKRVMKRSAVERASVLSCAVEACVENPHVSSFWGDSVVGEARELVARLVAGESVGNAVNLKKVSAVIAADLAFGGDAGLSAVINS